MNTAQLASAVTDAPPWTSYDVSILAVWFKSQSTMLPSLPPESRLAAIGEHTVFTPPL
jgi:hypothetical protein